jgi:hypothetical protein
MMGRQHSGEDGRFVRRYDYEDGWVIAADVGVADDRLATDIVDGTAMVLVDDRVELEFEVPGSVETVDTNNGVLVVRGDR